MAAVLVDSSIWIAASKRGTKEAKSLAALLRSSTEIFITQLIRLEVTQGAKMTDEFNQLWNGFGELQFLETTPELYHKSARNYFHCKKRGISLMTVDCLIATLTAENQLPIWSLDKIFQRLAPILGFEIYKP